MASRNSSRLPFAALVLLAARPLGAQAPSSPPLRLSFAEAVARAAGKAPAVELAGLRTTEARARVRQAQSYLFPSFAASAGWLNRTFNRHSLGIEFPTAPGSPPFPDLIGPFDNVDARLRVSQTIVDFSGAGRVGAARAQVAGFEAEGGAVA